MWGEFTKLIERRSRVHVEVWAHGERLGILNRRLYLTTEKLKAPCDTFTAIGRCHNRDTQGQRGTKGKAGTDERPRWKKDLRRANHELEAAVGRGKSKSGSVKVRGLGVRTRKTNFRCPQVELSTPLYLFIPRAARQLKVARPSPYIRRSPSPGLLVRPRHSYR